MTRHALTDAQWAQIEPLLPPQKPATGRPAKDHRTVVEGILWQKATGAPWRELPERYGPWETVYSRLRRWQRAGVWDRVDIALRAEPQRGATTTHTVRRAPEPTGTTRRWSMT